MLILSRPENGRIKIGDDIAITVLHIQGNQVRLGVDAPKSVNIAREELIAKLAPPTQHTDYQK